MFFRSRCLIGIQVLLTNLPAFGAENVGAELNIERLLITGGIDSAISSGESKNYIASLDQLAEEFDSGIDLVLKLADFSNSDIDLFIYGESSPEENFEDELICFSNGIGEYEECRLFFADLSAEFDSIRIEIRGLSGEEAEFEVTASELETRLQDTDRVISDAIDISQEIIRGLEDLPETEELILNKSTVLTSLRASVVYKFNIPALYEDALLKVDLIGTRPRGEAEIRVYNSSGILLDSSFNRELNSAVSIPNPIERDLYLAVLAPDDDTFFFADLVEVQLNFRPQSSVRSVRLSPETDLVYSTDEADEFNFIVSPQQIVSIRFDGCEENLLPTNRSNLTVIHRVSNGVNREISDEHVVFFGEPAFPESNGRESVNVIRPLTGTVEVRVNLNPMMSQSASQFSRYESNRVSQRTGICNFRGSVLENSDYAIAFDFRDAINQSFTNVDTIGLSGTLAEYETKSYRIARSQVGGATGIRAEIENSNIHLAIVQADGIVLDISEYSVQQNFSNVNEILYLVLFKPPYINDVSEDARYSLDLQRTFDE